MNNLNSSMSRSFAKKFLAVSMIFMCLTIFFIYFIIIADVLQKTSGDMAYGLALMGAILIVSLSWIRATVTYVQGVMKIDDTPNSSVEFIRSNGAQTIRIEISGNSNQDIVETLEKILQQKSFEK